MSRARKDRAKASKRARADANAHRFGRSKAEKARDENETAKARRDLDGHARE
nr:DUF4169 family protein [Jannaschia sp. S6380]